MARCLEGFHNGKGLSSDIEKGFVTILAKAI